MSICTTIKQVSSQTGKTSFTARATAHFLSFSIHFIHGVECVFKFFLFYLKIKKNIKEIIMKYLE